jgi:oxygen-dependent protoporphyrinogen oxidase
LWTRKRWIDGLSHPLDGFGLLVPSKESSTRILGALFSSSVFPNRAPEEHVLLTALIGGARKAELTDLPDDLLLDLTIDDLHALLGVHGEPTFVRRIDWPHAIPQYNLGYEKAKTTLETIEKRHPGLYFAGNYRQGISVGDAMQSGEDAADRMAAFVSGRETAWRGSST